jgi:hypothetical protein
MPEGSFDASKSYLYLPAFRCRFTRTETSLPRISYKASLTNPEYGTANSIFVIGLKGLG